MTQVLLLNATYEPLTWLPMRRAVILLMREKAEVVEADVARKLRSENFSLSYPVVIKLVTYVRIPFARAALSRRAVLLRDQVCQYCARAGTKKNPLTVEHVLPRSRGGEHTWLNVVAACLVCNNRKGARTPEEANMKLLREPFTPKYAAIVLLARNVLTDKQRELIEPYAMR